MMFKIHVLLAALLPPSVGSFSSMPRLQQLVRRHSSCTMSSRNMVANAAPEEQKTKAIDALQKLLNRQTKELEETTRLLEELKSAEGEVQDKKSFTLASSVLSGFDYGFVSRSQGVRSTLTGGGFAGDGNDGSFESYGPPANIIVLGSQQFIRNLKAMKDEYDDEEEVELTPRQRELREKLEQLTLNSTAIWERELAEGPLNAPFLIKIPYVVLCWFLDVLFEGRYVFSRFFLLETVARMPYFSYITMLHLYESLGFWRRSSDIKRIHFAEEWNEFHHLLIMESLGGDQRWWVRAVSQHSAMVYYIVLCILWAMSPTLAYKFSELLESHAVNTYGGFVEENKDLLKTLPPSMAAIQYYSLGGADPFFGEYQTTALATGGEIRRPGETMRSLYDVFKAIQADEGDHVGTMKACLDPNVAVQSPSLERKVLAGAAVVATAAFFVSMTGDFSGVPVDDTAMDSVATGLTDGTLIDGVVAGLTGLTSKFAADEENRDIAEMAADAMETSGVISLASEAVRKAIVDAAVAILEFLAKLL